MISIHEEIKHNERILPRADEIWGWDTPAGHLRAERRAELLIKLSLMSAGKKVLELGCGTGIFSDFFKKTGASVVVMDVSYNFLLQARKRNLGLIPITGDAGRLPFTKETFDIIVGSSVLHHLELQRCLPEINRVLRPGGNIAFAEPNMLNPQVALERSCPFIRRMFNATADETAFLKWKITDILYKNGFLDISVKPFGFLHPQTPSGCIKYIMVIETFLERIPIISEIAGSLVIAARKKSNIPY